MTSEKRTLAAKNIVSISESLQERKNGICLEPNHAKMIWQGNKDVIIKDKSYRFATNKPFYLIGGNECYGVLVLTKATQINLTDFETFKNRHRITDDERKGWWPNKQVLYRYDFVLVEKFESPRLVKVKDGEQTFLHDITFIGESNDIEKIESAKKYNPTDLRTDQLKNNFRIVLAWHSSKTKGIEIPYSYKGIEKILKLTYDELLSRGIVFQQEKMDPSIKEIFEKISSDSKNTAKDEMSEFVGKYKPMDPASEYNNINKLIPKLYQELDEIKYEVEKNHCGKRILAAKKNGVVKLYSFYSLKDVTNDFTNFISSVSKLSKSDFILDCKLSANESNEKLYVSDVLYKEEDLTNTPWHNRYKVLKRLNFNEPIKEIAGIVVNNKEEARKAIKLFCWMSSTEGAIVKKYDSIYNQKENKDSWLLFKLTK